MKKLLFIAATLLTSISIASAQTFEKGTKVVTATVGFVGDYGIPVSASYEQGIYDFNDHSSIGIGGYLSYANTRENFEFGTYKFRDIIVALMSNYHYTAFKNIDLYGGLRLGYDIQLGTTSWEDDDFDIILGETESVDPKNSVAYDVHVGARYYPLRNFGINAEVGYGLSIFNVGLSYKF